MMPSREVLLSVVLTDEANLQILDSEAAIMKLAKIGILLLVPILRQALPNREWEVEL